MKTAPPAMLTREALADALGAIRSDAAAAAASEYVAGFITALDDCIDALDASPAILGRFTLLGQWVGAPEEAGRGYQAALAVVQEFLNHGTASALTLPELRR